MADRGDPRSCLRCGRVEPLGGMRCARRWFAFRVEWRCADAAACDHALETNGQMTLAATAFPPA